MVLHAALAAGVLFVGSTPCDTLTRRFVGVPTGAECERITWELTLSEDASAAFSLAAVYGMTAVNDPGFAGGGTKVELRGRWTIVKGTQPGVASVVYRLTTGTPSRTMEFARIDDDLLHPLNERSALMVGNPSWSYTLGRRPPRTPPARGRFAPWLTGAASSTDNSGAVANVAGVYEGRTPCQELARVLDVAVGADCTKIKWRLTLYRDSGTEAGGTYRLEGSKYRNPPRTGTWSIRTVPNDARVVYQLDPKLPGGFLSLLRADGNILLLLDRQGNLLVGDILFSYTLNRVK